nr:C-C chemokine receptor type 6a [Gasterosteus aculeatus aculeatus]
MLVSMFSSQQNKKTMNDSGDQMFYNDSDDDYWTKLVEPCEDQKNTNMELVVGPYVHSIICILGLVGNSLVIVTYAFYKRTKSMTDVYLLNVAVADFLFVASLPLIVYNELSSWSMGPVACKLLRGSYSMNLYGGMLLLACVGADRYVAIVQARRSFRLRSLRYSRLICGTVWSAALLLSLPTFYFYHRYEPLHIGASVEANRTAEPPHYVCELWFADNFTARTTKVAVPGTQLAVGFFLPLLVMVLCYGAIIVKLTKARNFQRHKAVRVVLVVVLVFVVCHLPYNVTLLYETAGMFQEGSCEGSDVLQAAKTLTQTLAYLHCCLNPVLYAFVGVKFRNHFRRLVMDLWCLGKRYIGPRRFSRVTSEIYVSTRRSVDECSDNGSSFTM